MKTKPAIIMAPAYCCKEPLTMDEAVLYTGLARQTLYNLISINAISYYKCGSKNYFMRTELDTFLFQNKIAADSEISSQADAILNGDVKIPSQKAGGGKG